MREDHVARLARPMDLIRVALRIGMVRVVGRRFTLVDGELRVHHPDEAGVLRVRRAVVDDLGRVDDDVVVAPEPHVDARRLADAFPTAAMLMEVEGARHADLADVGGEQLLDRVGEFLKEVVGRVR